MLHVRELMKHYIKHYPATRTHLILYAPQGFSLFLGQKLNALGDIIVYEQKKPGGYQVGVALQTG